MNDVIEIKIKNESKHETPKKLTENDSGFDIRANIDAPITLGTLERVLIPTGIFCEIPVGYEIQVRPRSGLAFKHGITVLNTPGTIDSDYRGEIKIILVNVSTRDFEVEDGMRIAQLVVSKIPTNIKLTETVKISEDTERGTGGFGHTGKF